MKPSLDLRGTSAPALGVLEIAPVPVAYAAVDAALKAASVQLLVCAPVTPGKVVAVCSGPVPEVEASVCRGVESAGASLVASLVLASVHAQVLEAVKGRSPPRDALGMLQTTTVAGAFAAADRLVKAADVQLSSIRFARRLGGDGVVTWTGALDQVEDARRLGSEEGARYGGVRSHVVIPRPDDALWKDLP